jgi:uncharacterized protein YbjT (DUF2867 family)
MLVTGGTGMLGKRLVPALVNSDHEVRIFSRHAQGDGRVHAIQAT